MTANLGSSDDAAQSNMLTSLSHQKPYDLIPVSSHWASSDQQNISGVALTDEHAGTTTNAPNMKNVPQFLNKLYTMVNEPSTDPLIRWSTSGESFLVFGQEQFSKVVLPYYFKTSNFSSFVRQLNMYGFHKVPHVQQGVLKSDNPVEVLEFSNANFLRDQPDLLCLVTRKKGGPQDGALLDLSSIMNEIQAIRKHQLTLSADLRRVQQDSEALWRGEYERRQMLQQLQEQQLTLDRVVKFLAGMYGKNTPASLKKKRKLMLGQARFENVDNSGSKSDNEDGNDVIELLDTASQKSPNSVTEQDSENGNMRSGSSYVFPSKPSTPPKQSFDDANSFQNFLGLTLPSRNDSLGLLQTGDAGLNGNFDDNHQLMRHTQNVQDLDLLLAESDDHIKSLVESLGMENFPTDSPKHGNLMNAMNTFDSNFLLEDWTQDSSKTVGDSVTGLSPRFSADSLQHKADIEELNDSSVTGSSTDKTS